MKDAVLPLYLIGNEKCRCSNSSEKEVQLFSNQAISLRNLVLLGNHILVTNQHVQRVITVLTEEFLEVIANSIRVAEAMTLGISDTDSRAAISRICVLGSFCQKRASLLLPLWSSG